MLTLDQLSDNQIGIVHNVVAAESTMTNDLLRRLGELGFLPGERVRIVTRGVPGGTPLAVRVGTATFALRLVEARCVQVTLATQSQ